jgi:hypothetical protein
MIFVVFYSTNCNPEGVVYGYGDSVAEVKTFIKKWKEEKQENGMFLAEEGFSRVMMRDRIDSTKWELLYVEDVPKLKV